MDGKWVRTGKHLKLLGEAIQPFALIFSAIGVVVTFAISERDKSIDRVSELSLPFYEKQLSLYAESSSIAARLAMIDKSDPSYLQTINRFWELYWGELSLVESTPCEANNFSDKRSVETLMVQVCKTYVSPDHLEKCTSNDGPKSIAIALAHHEGEELRDRWIKGGAKCESGG
jgi:hypothetical protein